MKKLMLLVVIAFALPACGKKNSAPPANAGDMEKKADPAADPCAGKAADPCAGAPADPCAGAANPCAPK